LAIGITCNAVYTKDPKYLHDYLVKLYEPISLFDHPAAVTMHVCDGQTEGQNYDPQDRASIAASRGKS